MDANSGGKRKGKEGIDLVFPSAIGKKFYVYATFLREDVETKGRKGGNREDSAPDEKRRGDEAGVEGRIRE